MQRCARYATLAFLLSMQLTYAESEHETEGLIRARYSTLTEGGNEGEAASALLRGNLTSRWNDQISTFVELDYVAAALDDEHSNGLRVIDKPSIPDVPGFDLNQLWLRMTLADFRFTLGRQAIKLDDQRFVGGNGFWQNEQTFDSVRVDKHIFSASNIFYSYVGNANRIFGDDADANRSLNNNSYNPPDRPAGLLGDHSQDTHLMRLEVNEWDYTRWVVYSYIMDNEELPAWSNATFGTRYEFTIQPGIFKYSLELEAAHQQRQDIVDKPTLNYGKVFFGISYASLELSGRYEYLEAQNIQGTSISFVTPLGSLHDFQGWADIFVPVHGMRGVADTSFKLKWRTHPWKFDVRYHIFYDSNSSLYYGDEIDVDIGFAITKHQELHFRFAEFYVDKQSAHLFNDATKAFLTYSLKF